MSILIRRGYTSAAELFEARETAYRDREKTTIKIDLLRHIPQDQLHTPVPVFPAAPGRGSALEDSERGYIRHGAIPR